MDSRQQSSAVASGSSGGPPPVAPSAAEAAKQQQHAPRAPAADDASAPSSSAGPRRGVDKQQEYLEQKYGGKETHLNLTKEQVEGVLDRVLAESSTVKYLLESLKMVRRGPHGDLDGGWLHSGTRT